MRARALVLAVAVSSVGCTGCGSKTESVHVEVLAGVRHVAPGDAWDLEVRAYRATYGELLRRDGYRVVIAPISDRSLSEAPVFDATAAAESFFGMNQDDAEHARTQTAKRAEIALATLGSRRNGLARTEIINAVVAAHDRFDVDPGSKRHVLVILSTGFEQSSIANMADYGLRLNAPSIRRRFVEHLRATGQVVELRGVDVCMLAVTTGQGHWSDYNRSRGVRLFWRDYFAAAGARLAGYGNSVESCPPISAAQIASEGR